MYVKCILCICCAYPRDTHFGRMIVKIALFRIPCIFSILLHGCGMGMSMAGQFKKPQWFKQC